MIGILYFLKGHKIEENMCKWFLNKLDLGSYPTIFKQSEFTDMSRLIRESGFILLLPKLVLVLMFCSCWLIEM